MTSENLIHCDCGSEYFREVFTLSNDPLVNEVTLHYKCDFCGKLLNTNFKPKLYPAVKFSVRKND